MSLLFPAGLLALAGSLVPLLIHLQRQIQRTPVSFAALHWLSAAARPRQRLRLQQWLLLALRMAMIGLLALLLAGPVHDRGDDAERWVLIHPELPLPKLETAHPDTAYRWLAPGFPSIDSPAPPGPVATASLLREIDAQLPLSTALQVLLPAQVGGMDGQRLALRRALQVEVAAAAPEASAAGNAAALSWALRHADPDHPALAYLRAAAAALAPAAESDSPDPTLAVALDVQSDLTASPGGATVLWWLSDQDPLAADELRLWTDGGGLLIWIPTETDLLQALPVPLWRSEDGERVLRGRRQGAGWLLQPSVTLEAEHFSELLQPTFPELLLRWSRVGAPEPDRALSAALRPGLTDADAMVIEEPVETPLLVLLLALLVIERLVAGWRRSGIG